MRNLSRAKRAALRTLIADVKAGRRIVVPTGVRPRLPGKLGVRFDSVLTVA